MDERSRAHLDKSLRFAEEAERLAALEGLTEWAIVAFFYASLHVIDAYLTAKNGADYDPPDHRARQRAIEARPELYTGRGGQVARGHKALSDLSRDVRYNPGYVARVQDVDRARQLYKDVDAIVRPKLGDPPPPS